MNLSFRLRDDTARAIQDVGDALRASMSRTGTQVSEKIRDNLAQSQPAGRIYHHQRASAPGQAPADPQGNLAASIEVSEGDAGVEVTVSAPYAAYLELGTSRMAPRPFVLPAALAALAEARVELPE